MEHSNTLSNSPFVCKRVHYDHRVDVHEDIAIEGGHNSPLSEISKSSVKFSGDANSEISIATSILDIEEDHDAKVLTNKLEDYEYKIKYLENENKRINEDLLIEKRRTTKLEKKLQFVKDNQEVFMRLKEAYINMKYNEAAGRKMIEIREKGVQTWEGTICSSCIESEELRRQIDIMIQKYSELFVVSPGEMEHLMNTVKYLRDLIDRREESWALNMERETKYKTTIAVLEDENVKLRSVITNKEDNVEVPNSILECVKLDQTLLEERKIEEMQKFVEGLTKDLEKLKKIIIKYEKRFREMKDQFPGKFTSPLNEKEIKIVQQIILKYHGKIQKKITEEPVEGRSPSVGSERSRCCRKSASPFRTTNTRENSTVAPRSPERPKRSDTPDQSAIMMMDCLFE